ncbi:MAG: glucosamine-6-phosphate deaminase [Clostridia bacterium]|nr:glucosamine-6-phosphate deaminase [Clostridiaceae bacterium]
MNIITVKDYDTMSKMAAGIIAAQINTKPDTVLGLATGSSPLGTYRNLIEMNQNGLVDFSKVVTFNLDEYCGLSRENPQSYYYFMMENLFKHVNIPKENIHIPNGLAKDTDEECKNYELQIKKANGVDLQLLGIGFNGHIGFNEPDDVFHNFTRRVKLTQSTIEANKRFFESADDVPRYAISMGIKTIMSARKIILVAGPEKREIIDKLREEVCTPQVPASILHYHPDCTVFWAEKE